MGSCLPYRTCETATFVEGESGMFDPACPIHPEWFKYDNLRLDVIVDGVFKFRSNEQILQESANEFGQVEVVKIWTEAMIMSSYRDFISRVTGVLRDLLDVASALQTKIYGGIATLLITLLNFVFQEYVHPTEVANDFFRTKFNTTV